MDGKISKKPLKAILAEDVETVLEAVTEGDEPGPAGHQLPIPQLQTMGHRLAQSQDALKSAQTPKAGGRDMAIDATLVMPYNPCDTLFESIINQMACWEEMAMESRCILLWMAIWTGISAAALAAPGDRIDIYSANRAYWQYEGRPVVLIGGSKDDNLFQLPDLKEHLDLLASVGGNYVRNTMSARQDKGFEVQAFQKRADGKYDLDRWNEEYWQRFESLLSLGAERDIIVQIEIWATFDYYRDHWEINPFNPKNNVNYTAKETGLPVKVNSHPTRTENNFFWSVPAERNQKTVLKYQQRFVDKLLSISLKYGNVLYCMDNETSVTPQWGWYWSNYIQAKAKEAGVTVHTTEMWDAWDLANAQHNATFDHPEVYSFVDISQNNHQKGQAHWDNAQKQRARIAEKRRPLNCVKIYGADTGRFGSDRDGMERFWRNIMGGLASARFHRPISGQGLGVNAQANLKSMRMLLDKLDVFACEPHNDLLSDRQSNEAYCLANPGTEYAVYFTHGGDVTLDVSAGPKSATVLWIDIMKSKAGERQRVEAGGKLKLKCPSDGYWVALVQ